MYGSPDPTLYRKAPTTIIFPLSRRNANIILMVMSIRPIGFASSRLAISALAQTALVTMVC